ncbi:response regulator [Pimelobacter simplex]|uniref:DNA-binding response regulator, LuxR family n=1 Tax=Nocardioides simplex TaxID=2045 RepID=A0A0A1DEG6_NOCSI|nr:response regulator transcription factor [Pimelobacter simplex]AIY15591.1 DNA-binding response regulator, LuxR family [Pimelobacter simplex]MCG8150668.1 response regulator [Pimelobacter simplex]GEB15189.1 DNA-binding response regulator [Pimelobacter simplex]SFM85294.1 two component transcriptional regulator, LuxR family [Pimelobacter simplex]
MTTRVLIADDDALLRAGLAVVVGTDPGLALVGEAADGLDAVRLTQEHRPDVVLMDVRMPGVDGIEATRRIVASGSPARVLVLTTFADDDYVAQALRAGASGFLLKRVAPERLLEAIRTVAQGDALLDPAVTRAVVARSLTAVPTTADPRLVAALTEREREVLALVGEGRSNPEIAALLTLAESTVQTHVKRILAKLGARDRAQAVVVAYRSGLVSP